MKKKIFALGSALLASAPIVFARHAPAAVYAKFGGNCKEVSPGEWVCKSPESVVEFIKSGEGISMLVIFILIGIGIYLYTKNRK